MVSASGKNCCGWPVRSPAELSSSLIATLPDLSNHNSLVIGPIAAQSIIVYIFNWELWFCFFDQNDFFFFGRTAFCLMSFDAFRTY